VIDVPSAFEVRILELDPGCDRPYDEREWLDAIVVIGRGEVELECNGGTRKRLESGDVLWLAGLPVRAICNRGGETAVLVSFSRRLRAV
jgi:hypothetical protein